MIGSVGTHYMCRTGGTPKGGNPTCSLLLMQKFGESEFHVRDTTASSLKLRRTVLHEGGFVPDESAHISVRFWRDAPDDGDHPSGQIWYSPDRRKTYDDWRVFMEADLLTKTTTDTGRSRFGSSRSKYGGNKA